MANKDTFRICPTTGFKVFRSAETLIKVNAVAAVVFLLVGGLFGIALALTRWPAVQILPADWFYLALTAHGLDVLLVWIIFFEMAVLYFASSVLLGARLATPRIAWLGFALMLIGAVVTNVAVLQGESTVMFTSYVPMKAAPHFYLGILLFAVGALLGCFVFLGTLVVAKAEKTYKGSVPLVTFGALTAAIIAIFTIASGAIILLPTFLWSLGYISHIDTLMYKTIWWAMGHSSQQINVSAHIAIWYLIAAMVFGAKPLSEKVSRMAFFMYILFLQLASAHHLLVEPGLSPEWKIFNTSYALYLAVLGSLIHGLTVPGSIEAAQRRKGYNNGLFEWLRKAPWSNPAFSGMFLSLLMFGILGGITGVILGTEQINIIMHNTMYVPGHFHGTVVGGTTLAFMAVTYPLVNLIFRRELILAKWAQWQPYVFALGVTGLAMAQMGAGTLGVSRRHWDITFADALFKFEYPAAADVMMALNGIFGVIAGIGGAMYIIVVVGSLLVGKQIVDTPQTEPAEKPEAAVAGEYGSAGTMAVPGTAVMVAVFFTAFVLYYFVNWKYLSEIWPLQ